MNDYVLLLRIIIRSVSNEYEFVTKYMNQLIIPIKIIEMNVQEKKITTKSNYLKEPKI